MSNNKIFPARRVFPVIEQIRELYREAAEVPGAEEQVVVDKATLEVLYAAALELERNTPTLVVGLHTHDSGVSPYVFAVDPFIPFGLDDFQEYLEETFEPWKNEYLDIETNIDAIEIRAVDAHQSTAAEPAQSYKRCRRVAPSKSGKTQTRLDGSATSCAGKVPRSRTTILPRPEVQPFR